MNKVAAHLRQKCDPQGSPLSNICYTLEKTDNSVHMNLVSKSFLGFLVDPLGRHPRSLTLQEKGIATRGAGSPWIGLEDISTRPSVKKGLLSSSLLLDLEGGRNLTLPAVDTSAAKKFAEAAATAWTDFNRE
jgi:DNA helicase-4